MISPFQVIAVVFGLFALSRVFLRLKDNRLSHREFMFWTVIWVFLMVIALFPDLTTDVALKFGIEKGVNLVVSLSIIILFYIIFRLYVRVENLSHDITKIVRGLAVEKKKRKPEQ